MVLMSQMRMEPSLLPERIRLPFESKLVTAPVCAGMACACFTRRELVYSSYLT